MARVELGEPELLIGDHKIAGFACGNPALDQWLVRRALANQASGASRTYVATHRDVVIGYYALVAGSIAVIDAPSAIRRNMPDPIPVVLLGRLAVAEPYHGQGVGGYLLRTAYGRVLQASEVIGVAALLVHAIDDAARAFYLKYGFVESPGNQMTLLLSMKRPS